MTIIDAKHVYAYPKHVYYKACYGFEVQGVLDE